MQTRRGVAVLGVLGVIASIGIAVVAGPAGAAETDSTDAILRVVEASPRKAIATELVARSRAAVQRAAELRASGDETRARLADGLARTWADAARDVLRAVELEEKASTTRSAAIDAGAASDRERALLEEGIAQSGRLRAQLEAAPRDAKEQPARTSTAVGTTDETGIPSKAAPPAKATPTPKTTPTPSTPAPKVTPPSKAPRKGGAR